MSGDLQVDLLTQDEWWMDARGEQHLVRLMPERYVRRVVNYLTERAEEIELLFGVGETLAFDGEPGSDSERAMREALAERAQDPVGWLRTMPLMRRFRDMLAKTEEGAPW